MECNENRSYGVENSMRPIIQAHRSSNISFSRLFHSLALAFSDSQLEKVHKKREREKEKRNEMETNVETIENY